MQNHIISTIDLMPIVYDKSENKIKVIVSKRQNTNEPFFGQYAMVGGFIREQDGNIENAIRRIARDKIQAELNWLNVDFPHCVVGNNTRDPRGFAISHLYMVVAGVDINIQSKDWMYLDALNVNMDLAFDHNELIQKTIQKVRSDCTMNFNQAIELALTLLKPYKEFVLSELQSVYELLTGAEIDKKTFRRHLDGYSSKQVNAHFIKLDKKTGGKRARPADIYGFV